MSRQYAVLTHIDASLPTWANKWTPGSLLQQWKEELYGILYFLLHLDGLIDL